jgi:hypothetical protein
MSSSYVPAMSVLIHNNQIPVYSTSLTVIGCCNDSMKEIFILGQDIMQTTQLKHSPSANYVSLCTSFLSLKN